MNVGDPDVESSKSSAKAHQRHQASNFKKSSVKHKEL